MESVMRRKNNIATISVSLAVLWFVVGMLVFILYTKGILP
jgi:hypothetical protein